MTSESEEPTAKPSADGTSHGTEGPPGGGDGAGRDGETTTTVRVALAANLLIALAKLAGGLVAASPALMSEAAHSVADSLNEVFLLASIKRSRRSADTAHPFGYGKERFFWSLLAAVGIFVTGGCFSFFQGIEALRSGSSETTTGYVIGFVVLSVALLAEGTSLLRGLVQVRAEAHKDGQGVLTAIRTARDPALRTVLAEDSAACIGVVLAGAGMALHMATGQSAYEAVASLLIGALLVYVAYVLGRSAKEQLIGEAAEPELQRRIRDQLADEPEIDAVAAALTMRLGPHSVMLAARIDLVPGMESEEIEEALVRIRGDLRESHPLVDQIFLDVTDASDEDRERAARERRRLDRAVDKSARR